MSDADASIATTPTECVLEIADGRGTTPPSLVALHGYRWLLGRGPGADIALEDDSISRHHAEVRRCPFGRWWISDRASTNGTYVNGNLVDSKMLAPGDEISIGCFTLKLHASAPGGSEYPPALEGSPAVDLAPVAMPSPAGTASPEWLAQVLARGRDLASIEERAGRRRALCDWAVTELGALDAAVVRVRVDGTMQLLAGRSGTENVSTRLSRPLLAEVRRRRGPLAATMASADDSAANAVLAAPLLERGTQMELLYVELPSEEALEHWATLVPLLANAYEHADLLWQMRHQVRATAFVEHELDTARKIQRRLIAHKPRIDGLELIAGYEPCLWVGGDYVDAVALSDGGVLLVVADVCGKGLQGALVGSTLHTLVHSLDEERDTLGGVIGKMNRYLCRFLPDDSFVTLLGARLDPRSGRLECINAGHLPPLVARADGSIRELQSGENLPLGLAQTEFEAQTSELAPDELLLMYTDGFTELRDAKNEPLGLDRFKQGVAAIVAGTGEQPVRRLESELRRMIARHRRAALATDDAAFLIARRTASTSRARSSTPWKKCPSADRVPAHSARSV